MQYFLFYIENEEEWKEMKIWYEIENWNFICCILSHHETSLHYVTVTHILQIHFSLENLRKREIGNALENWFCILFIILLYNSTSCTIEISHCHCITLYYTNISLIFLFQVSALRDWYKALLKYAHLRGKSRQHWYITKKNVSDVNIIISAFNETINHFRDVRRRDYQQSHLSCGHFMSEFFITYCALREAFAMFFTCRLLMYISIKHVRCTFLDKPAQFIRALRRKILGCDFRDVTFRLPYPLMYIEHST